MIASVPVVRVTDGPEVDRSVYEVLVVVCDVTRYAPSTAVTAGPMVTHVEPLYDLTKSVSVS